MTIPTIIKEDEIEVKHPNRDELVQWWQFYHDAFRCRGGFGLDLKRVTLEGASLSSYHEETSSTRPCYLLPYSRENKEKFLQRTKSMYLPPYVKLKVIQPLVGFLTAKKPDRNGYPPAIEKWLEDCTDNKLSFDEYLAREGIQWALTYGRLPHVIDSDPHDAVTEADRVALGAKFARLRRIHTTRLWDWAYDDAGWLVGLKYETDMSDWDPVKGHKVFKRFRWVCSEGTWYVDQLDEKKTDGGYPVDGIATWNFPRPPLAELSFLDGDGIVGDMSGMILDLFNKLSQLNEVQAGSCFLPIIYPKPKGTHIPDAKTIGVLLAMPYDPEGGGKPEFMNPSMTPLDHLASWIDEKLVQWIIETGQTSPVFSAGQEAAATLAYRFQALDRFLRGLVKSLVEFEYQVCEVAAQWLGVKWDRSKVECAYNHTFDVLAIERLLDQLDRAKNDIGIPPTAMKVGKRRIIDGMELWGDRDETKAIEDELETEVETRKAADETPPPALAGGDQTIPDIQVPQPPGEVRK